MLYCNDYDVSGNSGDSLITKANLVGIGDVAPDYGFETALVTSRYRY